MRELSRPALADTPGSNVRVG